MLFIVSGACGHIGRYIIRDAVKLGHKVRAFDLPLPSNKAVQEAWFPQVEMVWGNITNMDDVRKVTVGAEAFIHLGAMVPGTGSGLPDDERRALAWSVNVGGTQNIIDAIKEVSPAARMVFASSGAVYGVGDAIRRVGNPLIPGDDEYGCNKVEAEQLVEKSGLDWTILRIVCHVIDPAALEAPTPLGISYRALNTKVEYGLVEDVSLAFVRAALEPACSGRILNVGGGPKMQTTHEEYLHRACPAFGMPMPPASAFPAKGRGGWADSEESEQLLHYQRGVLDDIYPS